MAEQDPLHPYRYEELAESYLEERSNPEWRPVRLGFGTVDAEIKGVSAGRVLGIAARTSVGKTSLLQSIEENFSHRTNAGQLLLTLEVTGEDWFERSLAIRLGISTEEVEEQARQRDGFHSFAESLYESRKNARIVQRCSLEQLPLAIQRARAAMEMPLRLVLIDYLGLLEVTGRDAYERASKIGVGLKRIAKEERVAIVIAVQFWARRLAVRRRKIIDFPLGAILPVPTWKGKANRARKGLRARWKARGIVTRKSATATPTTWTTTKLPNRRARRRSPVDKRHADKESQARVSHTCADVISGVREAREALKDARAGVNAEDVDKISDALDVLEDKINEIEETSETGRVKLREALIKSIMETDEQRARADALARELAGYRE